MTGRRAGAVILSLIVLAGSAVSLASAAPQSVPASLDASAFIPVAGFDAAAAPAPVPSPRATRPPAARIGDFPVAGRSFEPRPATAPDIAPRVVLVPTPTPRPAPVARVGSGSSSGGGAHRVSGGASWYCLTGVSACHYAYPGGLYAAAGSEIRVGDWRGRTVRVCGNGNCVSVKLIDWCACSGSRIIDLYGDAFKRLAPLDAGVLRVTVSW